MILLAIILFLTVLEAVHEGLVLRSHRTVSNTRLRSRLSGIAGAIEMVKLAGIAFMILFLIYAAFVNVGFWRETLGPFSKAMFWFDLVPKFVLGWIFIRYAIFDFIHNACAGIHLTYIGKAKYFDRAFNWIVNLFLQTEPNFFFWWTRVIFLAVGLSLILKI